MEMFASTKQARACFGGYPKIPVTGTGDTVIVHLRVKAICFKAICFKAICFEAISKEAL
jgi:hypothetical protein